MTPETKSQLLYFPTVAELLDRLSITQLKEFLITEHRDKYSKEISEILHDIDLIIKDEKIVFNAKMLRALIVLAVINREIWLNEGFFVQMEIKVKLIIFLKHTP